MEINTNISFEIEDTDIIDAVVDSAGFERAVERAVNTAFENQDPPDVEGAIEQALNNYDPSERLVENEDFIKAVAREVIKQLTVSLKLGVEGDEADPG